MQAAFQEQMTETAVLHLLWLKRDKKRKEFEQAAVPWRRREKRFGNGQVSTRSWRKDHEMKTRNKDGNVTRVNHR